MRTTICKYTLVMLGLLLLLPADADARRRRSSGNYYSTGNYSTTSNFSTASSTPKAETKPSVVVGKLWKKSRTNRTEFDYNWAAQRTWHNADAQPWLFSDRLRIKLLLRDDLASIADSLKIKLTWAYMHKSQHLTETWTTIEELDGQRYVELSGLEEGRLVKAKVEVFRPQNAEAAGAAKLKVAPVSMNAASIDNSDGDGYERVGAVHAPYYGVTGSETNDEWQRRAQIISFSFSQWYHDEAYGGRYCSYDCWSFYRKSADSELAGFTKKSISNSDVPRLSKEGKRFHGDYLIMGGHYGMALCYDEDREHFCSIEGNYALSGPHRIQIDTHYHGLYTWHTIMGITPVAKPAATPVQPVSAMN